MRAAIGLQDCCSIYIILLHMKPLHYATSIFMLLYVFHNYIHYVYFIISFLFVFFRSFSFFSYCEFIFYCFNVASVQINVFIICV